MHRRKIIVAGATIGLVAIAAVPANAVAQSGNRSCNPTNGYGWVQAEHKGTAEQRPPGGANKLLGSSTGWVEHKTFAGSPGGGSWRAYGEVGLQYVSTGCVGG